MKALHRRSLAALSFLLLFTPALRAAPHTPPHADVGEDRYPNADAVILRQEQTYTLADDRSITLTEHRWIKMLTPRAIRRVADPRISFRDDTDTVHVLVARTFTPDGQVVDVPDYSRNLVSPFGAANEPAFSTLRQWVISFSGVQPGAIYELAYERKSEPAELPWMSADLRLADDDPTVERVVTVNVPDGVTLHSQLDHVPADHVRHEETDGGRTHTWTFTDLAECRDEPADADWPLRCPRLRFTTCPDPAQWAGILVSAVNQCAHPDPAIDEFARDAIGDEIDARPAVTKICDKLTERMRTLNDRSAWEGPRGRLAGEAFASRYASALETAAVALTAVRAAGFDAAPAVAFDSRTLAENAPVDADVKGFWIVVTTRTDRFFVDPIRGIQRPYGENMNVMLFATDGKDNQVRSMGLTRGATDDARRLQIRANLEVDADGDVTGRLRVEMSGPLVDPLKLESDDQKRSRVESIVRRLLPGATVSDLSVLAFSQDELRAEGKLTLKDGLESVGRLRVLQWSDAAPLADGVHVPLEPKDRDTTVSLGSPLDESFNLSVEFPGEWKLAIRPQALPQNPSAGATAMITQTVKAEPHRIDVERHVRLPREIHLTELTAVRDSINRLRSPAWRQIGLRAEKQEKSAG